MRMVFRNNYGEEKPRPLHVAVETAMAGGKFRTRNRGQHAPPPPARNKAPWLIGSRNRLSSCSKWNTNKIRGLIAGAGVLLFDSLLVPPEGVGGVRGYTISTASRSRRTTTTSKEIRRKKRRIIATNLVTEGAEERRSDAEEVEVHTQQSALDDQTTSSSRRSTERTEPVAFDDSSSVALDPALGGDDKARSSKQKEQLLQILSKRRTASSSRSTKSRGDKARDEAGRKISLTGSRSSRRVAGPRPPARRILSTEEHDVDADGEETNELFNTGEGDSTSPSSDVDHPGRRSSSTTSKSSSTSSKETASAFNDVETSMAGGAAAGTPPTLTGSAGAAVSFFEKISEKIDSASRTFLTRKKDPDERMVRIRSEKTKLKKGSSMPSLFYDEVKYVSAERFQSLIDLRREEQKKQALQLQQEDKMATTSTGKNKAAATRIISKGDDKKPRTIVFNAPTTQPAASTSEEEHQAPATWTAASTTSIIQTSGNEQESLGQPQHEELQDQKAPSAEASAVPKPFEMAEITHDILQAPPPMMNSMIMLSSNPTDAGAHGADGADGTQGHGEEHADGDAQHGEEDDHDSHHVAYFATYKECTQDEEITNTHDCKAAGEYLFGIGDMQTGNIAIQSGASANSTGTSVGPDREGCYYERQATGTKRLIWKTSGDSRDDRSNTGVFLFVCKVHHGDEHIVPIRYPLLFLMGAFVVSIGVSYLSPLLRDILPGSLLLVAMGFLTNTLAHLAGHDSYLGRLIEDVDHADPHLIFWVLLPPLLYEDGSSADWRVLRPLFINAILLAIPGVMISFSLMGILIRSTLRLPGLAEFHIQHILFCTDESAAQDGTGFVHHRTTPDGVPETIQCLDRDGAPAEVIVDPAVFQEHSWPWFHAFLLGAILSATDPVAVIAALKALGAPARLTLLVAGEALLNDATGVVFFNVFWDLARDDASDFSFSDTVVDFVRLAGGGTLFAGIGMLVMHLGLKYTHHMSSKNFLFLTFFCVFGLFLVAEQTWLPKPFMPWSGVLAVVIFAFYVSAFGQNMILLNGGSHLAHAHHEVVSFVAGVANDVLFYLAGVVMCRYLFYSLMTGNDWIMLLTLYAYCHVARGSAIFSLMPLLSLFGFGMNWKEGLIGVIGGLRGAVGLAMALLVAFDHSETPLDLGFRLRIGFHTSGVALLTLCINGVAFPYIYNFLDIYPAGIQPSQTKMLKCATLAEGILFERLAEMKGHWLFSNLNPEHLLALVPRIADMLAEEDEKIADRNAMKNTVKKKRGKDSDSEKETGHGDGHQGVEARLKHLHHEYHGDGYYFKTFRHVAERKELNFQWEKKTGLANFILPSASESFSQRNEDAAAWLHGGFGKDYEMVIHIFYYAMMSALERAKLERGSMAIWPAAEIGEALEFTHEAMQGVLRADKSLNKSENLMIKKFFPKMPVDIWTEDQDTQQLFALEVGFCKLLSRLFGRDSDLPWALQTRCCRTMGTKSTDVESASKTLLLYCLLLENTRASLQPILAGGEEEAGALMDKGIRQSVGGGGGMRKSVALEAIRQSMMNSAGSDDVGIPVKGKKRKSVAGGGRASRQASVRKSGLRSSRNSGPASGLSLSLGKKKKKKKAEGDSKDTSDYFAVEAIQVFSGDDSGSPVTSEVDQEDLEEGDFSDMERQVQAVARVLTDLGITVTTGEAEEDYSNMVPAPSVPVAQDGAAERLLSRPVVEEEDREGDVAAVSESTSSADLLAIEEPQHQIEHERSLRDSRSATSPATFEGRHNMPVRSEDEKEDTAGAKKKKKKALPVGEALNMLDRSLSAVLTAARTTLIKCVFEKFPSQSNIWLHAFVCQALTQDLYKQLELSEKNGLLLPNELELLNHNVFHAVLHKLAKYTNFGHISENFPDLDVNVRQSKIISRGKVLTVDDMALPIGPVVLANLNKEMTRKQQTRAAGKRANKAGGDRHKRKKELLDYPH
ncbi:unnamed protein product [Amoebophrya sp. A120]|nr:unnamed protein product [Amoebophrya sp. A120]|eukprot:GSA120T00022339001.1